MQISKNPDKKEWKGLLQRPYVDNRSVLSSVQTILEEVKAKGDEAIRHFTKKFDGVELKEFEVAGKEIRSAEAQLPDSLKMAISRAKSNIELFHKRQINTPEIIETMPGIQCWRKSIAIEKVGLYIPGGTAPLFSTALMLGV